MKIPLIRQISPTQAPYWGFHMLRISCSIHWLHLTLCYIPISGLLTSAGKTSWEALILKESTKIVEKLSVNSRCNSIYKKLVSTPVDIALQTGKNSGPSERKAVQAQICKYIWGIISSFVANYPKKSLYGSTLTKPLRQFHDLQRNIHRLIAIPFVLVIEPIKNKKLNSELFARNPLLLARPQTFVLHQILRHVSSSEFG